MVELAGFKKAVSRGIDVVKPGRRKRRRSDEVIRFRVFSGIARVDRSTPGAVEGAAETFPNSDVDREDLALLNLELRESLGSETLALFIEDPRNRGKYWFRKIRISTNVVPKSNKNATTLEIERLSSSQIGQGFILETDLEEEVKRFEREQIFSSLEERAVVGVVSYTGEKNLTLNGVMKLAALKYNQLRTTR